MKSHVFKRDFECFFGFGSDKIFFSWRERTLRIYLYYGKLFIIFEPTCAYKKYWTIIIYQF